VRGRRTARERERKGRRERKRGESRGGKRSLSAIAPSRKKKWQLPWLDGAYETIIPRATLPCTVRVDVSARARQAGRAATVGKGGRRGWTKGGGVRKRRRGDVCE
jgi:hypothetical protein